MNPGTVITPGAFRPQALSHVSMHAQDPARWGGFAEELFGARCASMPDGAALVRFDEQAARVRVLPGVDGALAAIGWQMRDELELAGLIEQIGQAGHRVESIESVAAEGLGFEHVAIVDDPFGNRIELCCHPVMNLDHASLAAPAAHLGHVVLGVPDLGVAEAFYVGALGLRVTDRITFQKAGRNIELSFLRAADRRHHSLALAGGGKGINHLMIELADVDAVGRCLDQSRARGDALRRELGRHSNDLMYSFYAASPNGIDVEVGCDGICIDEASWQIKRHRSVSRWGHRLL